MPVQKNNQSVPSNKEKRILFIFYVYVYIAQNKSNLIENLIKTISEYEITWAGLDANDPMKAAYRQIIATLNLQLKSLTSKDENKQDEVNKKNEVKKNEAKNDDKAVVKKNRNMKTKPSQTTTKFDFK